MTGSQTLYRRIGILTALIFCAPTHATEERWDTFADKVFFNLSAEQGLPFGRVSGVAQDADGFMWLVTPDGLMRWDGQVIQPMSSGLADVDNDVRAIQADDVGRFWLGTGKGLRCFDPSISEVHQFPLLPDDSFAVLTIETERRPTGLVLWAGTERGVFEVDVQSGAVVQHLKQQVSEDRTMRVFSVLRSDDGSVWAGTSIGLYRKPQEASDFSRFDLGPELSSNTRIAAMLQTDSGDIWVGTPREGAFVIDSQDVVQPVEIPGLANEWIFSMAEVAPGVIWLGTYGRGVIEVASDGAVRRMESNPLLNHSLGSDEVWTIKPDRSGLIWVGTGSGLSIHDSTQTSILTAFGGSGRDSALRDREVKSLLETADGKLLVGLRESGVDIIDPLRGRIGSIDVDPENPQSALPNGAVEAMAQAGSGDIYIGSNWGLYRYRDSVLERMKFDQREEVIFTGSLLHDDGYLWAGGIDGLWRLSMNSTPAKSELVRASVGAEFTDPRISTLARHPGGGLVVGTWNGINWINQQGELLDRIPARGQADPVLDNGYITSIVHDASDRVWFGTSGAGIYVQAGGTGPLQHITREHGMPSDMIASLQVDGKGRIWASSNSGMAVIDPETLNVTALGPADGAMVAPYFRQPATTTRHGEILFGGDGGLTVIKPDEWVPRTSHSPLAITSVRVDGDLESNRMTGLSEAEPVIIPAERNAITVEFAALDFLAAKTIRYRHLLEGYDRDWRVAEAGYRTAGYTSLSPGNYRFKVQASNRQGAWGGEIKSVYFSVLPFWYQTRLAMWLGAAAAVLLIMGLFRWRTAKLRSHQELLESLIGERTRELEASAEALRLKSVELEKASMTDPLTGMRNRRFLEKNMATDQAMGIRRYRDARGKIIEDADLLFFVVDIDHFKQVNDRHGHAAGDLVITAMRKRLQEVFRESDYLVRWGGEEFLVVARATSREHAAGVAERIRLQVQDTPFDVGHGVTVSKTCSIGFSALPFDLDHPEAIDWLDSVRLADLALFTAKRAGRNAWVGVSAGPNFSNPSVMQQLVTTPALGIEEDMILLESNLDQMTIEKAWSSQETSN